MRKNPDTSLKSLLDCFAVVWTCGRFARRETMSRCYPFPPPGYEAKPKSEHGDLLKKEKRSKKKHKKEKKDRGQGEKKEKDQGHKKDKRNNKKHKRGKHKDRRKNKESEKEKKHFLEQETRKNDYLGNRSGTVKDSKPTDELVTQITYQKGLANHTCSSTSKLSPRSIECSVVVSSKEKEITSLGRVAEKSGQIAQRNHASEKGKDSGYGSNTRIQNGKSLQVGSAEKRFTRKHDSNGPGLRRATTPATQQNGRSSPSPNSFERIKASKHSDGCSHYVNAKGDSMSARGMMEKENGSANNFHTRMDQQQVRGKDGRVEVKAKIKDVKANHHKVVKGSARNHNVNLKGVKDKDGDGDVKKRKARGKSKNKEEENGVPNELKQNGLDAHEARKNNARDIMDLAHLNEKLTSDDVKKRKDLETISSLHEHSMRMAKLPRMSPANLSCLKGEILNHSQGTAHYSSTVLVDTDLCEIDKLQDSKECYNNGITGSRYLEEHTTSISACSYDSNEVFLAPPHPDTKYLSQVYSVPAAADCSEYIDQDWLFCGAHVHRKTAMFEAAESPQIWAEARQIDSADIVALPYVVPY